MVPKILLLIKQIRPRAPQVDDLRTSIPILLHTRALKAVRGVRDPFAAADNALVPVVAKRAVVADADLGCGAHVGIADGTLAVAFIAQAADVDAGHFAAHDKVAGVWLVYEVSGWWTGLWVGLTGDGETW